MSAGDLYRVESPVRGHAQAGRRPAIVVQPATALVEVTAGNCLKRPSVALAFQWTAIDKQFIGAHLSTLPEAARYAVQQTLDSIMDRV